MKPKTHAENQAKVCVLCLQKNNLQNLSEKTAGVIEARYLPDIKIKSWYYPQKICRRCSFAVSDCDQNLQVHVYRHNLRVTTRSDSTCQCDVCEAARVTLPNISGVQKSSKKRGRPSGSGVESKKQRTAKLCMSCYTEIGKGISHKCTRSTRHNNVLELMEGEQQKDGDSIVAAYLRERSVEGSVTLSNLHGQPSNWTTGSSTSESKARLTVDDLFLIKRACDMSTRKTLVLSSSLRGLNIEVPQNLPRELTSKNRRLQDFFAVCRLPFEIEKNSQLKPVVYCTDVEGMIEQVLQERRIERSAVFLKIGADGGGGSFKITASIVAKEKSVAKGSQDTGVKQLLLLAVAPGIPEKYSNIAKIWKDLLHIDHLKAYVAADLKMVNLLLGIMGHSASYPCPYCYTPKPRLSQECSSARSLRSISKNYQDWKNEGADDKKARDHFNCIEEPLLCGEPEEPTVMLCPPPVLHIVLGIVNAVYKGVEAVDEDVAEQWVVKSSCQRHSKYGFTGRNCHKLLTNRYLLEPDGQLGVFRSVLDHFEEVFKACLQESLAEDFESKLESFAESWSSAGLPNSSKFHILRFHVPEFCKSVGHGLGRYGEQASETVHFDYGLTWDKVKVPETSGSYDEHLLHSVVLYNSSHL